MNDKPIKVLVVEPMQPCRVQEISGLKDMRDIVGGPIQVIYPFWESVALVCNESGKIQGLPYNRPLFGENGCPYDIICGNFFVAGIGAFYLFNRGTDSEIQGLLRQEDDSDGEEARAPKERNWAEKEAESQP